MHRIIILSLIVTFEFTYALLHDAALLAQALKEEYLKGLKNITLERISINLMIFFILIFWVYFYLFMLV